MYLHSSCGFSFRNLGIDLADGVALRVWKLLLAHSCQNTIRILWQRRSATWNVFLSFDLYFELYLLSNFFFFNLLLRTTVFRDFTLRVAGYSWLVKSSARASGLYIHMLVWFDWEKMWCLKLNRNETIMPKLAARHWSKQPSPSSDFTHQPGVPGPF